MTDRSILSEKELKALVYFVVGVSSEGSIAGKDVSSRLSFAGEFRDGKMYPVENSGFSTGTLQKDLGQDNQETAKALVSAYQAWAKLGHPGSALTSAEMARTISDLSRNGKTITNQEYRAIDAGVKIKLDTFLRSDGGRDFVHGRDAAQVDRIYDFALSPLTATLAYKKASIDDRIKLATVVAKGFNQRERTVTSLLVEMQPDSAGLVHVKSLDEVLAYSERKFSPSMREGRDAALRGAEIYNRLRHATPQNPLRDIWQEVLNEPLIKPTVIGQDPTRPDFAAQYTTVKNLFLEPSRSKRFIDALEQGQDHSYGRPQAVGEHRATSGFYASGTDFVQWNAAGMGFAHIDGQWAEVSRDDIARVRHLDTSVDLAISRDGTPEPLLHVGPTGPTQSQSAGARPLRQGMHGDDVRALQSQLAELGFTDSRGRPLRPDGDFGPTTHGALQAFQREHGLTADGVAGPATLAETERAVQNHGPSIAQPDAPHLRHDEGRDAMSAYRAFGSEPIPGAPVAAASHVWRSGPTHTLRDPRHAESPHHQLYNELQRCIPDASEPRLLQFTAACHAHRITADNLDIIHLNEEKLTLSLYGTGPLSTPAKVDLNVRPPTPEQAIEQIQQFDRQQTQMMEQFRSQNAQLSHSGPRL